MERISTKFYNKSVLYQNSSDCSLKEDIIDIVSSQLNKFVQAFKDIITFISEKENNPLDKGSSLRRCVSECESILDINETGKDFLKELVLRNELTHDYFNFDINEQKLISIMYNCPDGALQICDAIKEYCIKKDILQESIIKL